MRFLKAELLGLIVNNLRSKLAEAVHLKFGVDFTRPAQVYGTINTRCNARCAMCDCWRDQNGPELPAVHWIRALKSLKESVGNVHANFSGGEPLLKKDLFDILDFCKKEKIPAGLTTNGFLLDAKNVDRLLDCNLFNLNISIDSMDEAIHDKMRGVPGLLARVRKNLDYLKDAKSKRKVKMAIILKTIVCAENLGGLDKIAEYAKDMGFTGVTYQPILKRSAECSDMMANPESGLFNELITRLLEMKKNGYPILNTAANIKQWRDHFDGKIPPRRSPCTIALRTITIQANGYIYLCTLRRDSIIGNIADDDLWAIWRSEKAKEMRKNLVKCPRLCTAACVTKRNLKDYLGLMAKLVKRS